MHGIKARTRYFISRIVILYYVPPTQLSTQCTYSLPPFGFIRITCFCLVYQSVLGWFSAPKASFITTTLIWSRDRRSSAKISPRESRDLPGRTARTEGGSHTADEMALNIQRGPFFYRYHQSDTLELPVCGTIFYLPRNGFKPARPFLELVAKESLSGRQRKSVDNKASRILLSRNPLDLWISGYGYNYHPFIAGPASPLCPSRAE